MAATTTTLTILLLVLLLPFTSPSTTPQTPGGLNTFLTTHYHTDPFSLNDTFPSLPKLPKLPLSTTPLSPFSLTIPITLHVTLVSPHPNSASLSTHLLSSFLSSLNSTSPFHVITPFDPTHPHHLAVSSSLHITVTVSRPSLSSALSSAVSAALDSSIAFLRSTLTPIPHSVVDDSIRKEYESESSSSGDYAFRLYLLDLGQQPKPYAYRYTESDGGSMSSTCLGTVWVGKERYAWVDLGAGPVEYGPGLAGDGVVPRGEFHPMGTLHGRGTKSEKAVVADLAALVYGAYQVMAVPDLRIPVPFVNTLVVRFFHVREKGMMEKDDGAAYALDWRGVEKSFRDEAENGELLLAGQTLSFKRHEVDYTECAVCSFAVARATNSYTSRFLFDNYTLIVSEYVDSKALHRVLSDSMEEIKKLAGVKEEEEDFGRVLPVYVFDLDQTTLLLLDRYHQSVAFKDMVIAIRTRNAQTVSDYSCNGRHVFTQTRELERPLVGSILQSMWGVSPTHLSWSAKHNSTVVDYTWSVGHTPFGPFSEISSLSFVQKDAARRNVLLTWLNDSITSAIDVLESVNGHGGAEALLKGSKHDEFLKRWFLFKYKLDKVAFALSRLDFKMSLYFLRSSDHDLYAMRSMVYHASQGLEASLVCFKDPPIPWVPGLLGLLALFVLAYGHSKRERVFKNKRKQF